MRTRVTFVDERTILESEFKDIENRPVNVSEGVVVYILKPNSFEAVGPFAATRTAKGIYRYDYYPDIHGRHRYQFQTPSGDIVSDGQFNVKRSVFDVLPPFPAVESVASTAVIVYSSPLARTEESLGFTAEITYVAVDALIAPTFGAGASASMVLAGVDADYELQFQPGDLFFIQPGTVTNATLDANVIGYQKRTSYPAGPLDSTQIYEILSYAAEGWSARNLKIDEHNNKLVIVAQDDTDTYKWYVYTCNFDGSSLTKIYDAPVDATPGRDYSINGLAVNNRSDAPDDERIWVSVDGTYGLNFRGILVSMAYDGTGQVTQKSGRRSASDLMFSDVLGRMYWDVDDSGYDQYSIDPLTTDCHSHVGTIPSNSVSGCYDGVNFYIYNLDAFGTIRRSVSDVCGAPAFNTWIASHPAATSDVRRSEYSYLTNEILMSGNPGRNYDADDKSSEQVAYNGSEGSSLGTAGLVVFQGGPYQV